MGFSPKTVPVVGPAAGMAHASAARVLHCARLLNTAVVSLPVVALILGFLLACVGWFVAWR